MRTLFLVSALVMVLAATSMAEDSPSAAPDTPETTSFKSLKIRLGAATLQGHAGFDIDARPYRSLLEFPVGGTYVTLSIESRPFATKRALAFGFEAFFLPAVRGTTQDTDWIDGLKWLYSRSRTEGTAWHGNVWVGYDIIESSFVDVRLRSGGFFARDVFSVFDLRQYNLMPDMTVPPWPEYEEVPGEVARYDMRVAGLALGAVLDIKIHETLHIELGGSLLPLAWVEGYGNWKLRLYRFQQYGPSFFTSHELKAEIVFHLAPWLTVSAGAYRVDWRADGALEDGQYAESPQHNYEAVGIVDVMRHLAYGFTFSLAVSL